MSRIYLQEDPEENLNQTFQEADCEDSEQLVTMFTAMSEVGNAPWFENKEGVQIISK